MRLELGEVTLYDSAVEYGPMHYSTKCSIYLISIDLFLSACSCLSFPWTTLALPAYPFCSDDKGMCIP